MIIRNTITTRSRDHVLTESELLEAVVRGAREMGLISDELAYAAVREFEVGRDGADLSFTANGAVLTMPDLSITPDVSASSLNVSVPEGTDAKRVAKLMSDALDEAVGQATGKSISHPNPDQEAGTPLGGEKVVETVKAELSKILSRPPSVATIRKWDERQRAHALKWARSAARKIARDEDPPKRPDFIVERAPRGSKVVKQHEEPAAPAKEEPVKRGGRRKMSQEEMFPEKKSDPVDDEDDGGFRMGPETGDDE